MIREIELELDVGTEYELEIESDDYDLEVGSAIIVNHISGDTYDGPYEVTPTAEALIIPTLGKAMEHDFVVNPIPKNYGLITWNGFEMTVS